jgi:thioesterase domain-containing protein
MMIRCALRVIVPEAPPTPIRLAGIGAGGLMALEAAIQLLGRDHAVEHVVLIDAPATHPLYAPWANASLNVVMVQTRSTDAATKAQQRAEWQRAVPSQQLQVLSFDHAAAALAALSRREPTKGRAATALAYEHVQTIQTGRLRDAAVFCIPGAGDSITRFVDLAGALGQDWTIHGLQPRGLDGMETSHSSVEAAARAYRRSMRAVHAPAAMHLIGHSFGGWVAFELAGLLESEGQPVASLTLIDTDAPDDEMQAPKEHLPLAALDKFLDVVEMSSQDSLRFDRPAIHAAGAEARLALIHKAMVQAAMMPARTTPQLLAGPLRTFCAALRTTYQPGHSTQLPVRLVFVPDTKLDKAGNEAAYAAMRAGWKRVAPQSRLWHGPGNHMTTLSHPHVKELSRWWLHPTQAML